MHDDPTTGAVDRCSDCRPDGAPQLFGFPKPRGEAGSVKAATLASKGQLRDGKGGAAIL